MGDYSDHSKDARGAKNGVKDSMEKEQDKNKLEQFNELDRLPKFQEDDEISLPLILPPDGGYGWVIAMASFFGNMIVDGVCYTFAVIYTELLNHFEAGKGKTALVGALVPAVYLIVGPLVGALCNKFGCRIVAMVGSILSAFAFVISAYSTSINMMLLTYGILGGIGFGLLYLPAIVMVGHYFDKKRAMATGIAVCGSGCGTFVFAPLGNWLVSMYGWKGANIIFGGIILQGCICGALMRPLTQNYRRCRDVPRSKIIESVVLDKKSRKLSCDSTALGLKGSMQALPATSNVLTVPVVSVTNPGGSTKNLGGSTVSLRIRRGDLSASQTSIERAKKTLQAPFARKDVLFGGSVTNLNEYRSAQDMEEYVAKVTDVQQFDEDRSKFRKLFDITMEMFQFSLLKSFTFLVVCISGVFVFLGLYTPFVYVTAKAITEMGVSQEKSGIILTILGICSTITRVIVGWIADRRWIDLLIIHNISAILAGVATCLVSVLDTYLLLCIYAAFFGVNIACFIALRSIVIVELLGVEKLNNAFGLTSLFQGIAVLLGSPMSGALVDATGDYVVAFVLFGSMIILGGVVCLPVRKIAEWERKRDKRNAGKV